MPIADSAAFFQGLLTMAGLIVAIGAQNAQVLRQGLARRHVGAVVAFCTVSDWLLVAAGVFGLGALLTRTPVLMQAMRFGGAAFLLWCAARAARRAFGGGSGLRPAAEAAGFAGTMVTTAALTWLNPHVYLDTVVLLGTVGSQQPQVLRLPFALGAGTASALWFSGLGFGAAGLARWLAGPAAWRVIDAGVALVLCIVGLQLLTKPLAAS
jgi:L-lysine exporter family protein LysE/ArgO